MPNITFCTYVTTDDPDDPLPPVPSVPVPARAGIKGGVKARKLVPSYFDKYLICWYGSTTLKQISDARRMALASGKTLHRVDILVDGGAYAPSRQHVNQLGDLGVLHVDELPKDAEDYVLQRLKASRNDRTSRTPTSDLIWENPDHLRTLWRIPDLTQLNAVIFSAQSEGDARVYYAAVHPRRIKEIRPPASSPSGAKIKIRV